MPAELLARLLKKQQRDKEGKKCLEMFSPFLRCFALTLQFYSAKAYNYVRKLFNSCLPHPSVLRRWYSSIEGEPGISNEALSALKLKIEDAKTKGKEVICSMLIDEMSIKKHRKWDGKFFYGYVDVGTEIESDELPLATEALVIMLVSTQASWKIPVAYYLIAGLSREERANQIKEVLRRLHEIGIMHGIKTHVESDSTKNYLQVDLTAMTMIRKYDLAQIDMPEIAGPNYIVIPGKVALSQYLENVVYYIAGYVVHMAEKLLYCMKCISALEEETCGKKAALLLKRKSRGGLVIPSDGVFDICLSTERCVVRFLKSSQNLPVKEGIVSSITKVVLEEVCTKSARIFPDLYEHMFDTPPEINHLFRLIKVISECYIKICMHHIGKCVTEKAIGNSIRKNLNRLVIFQNR